MKVSVKSMSTKKTNATKTNTFLTVTEVTEKLQTVAVGTKVKVYTDGKFYGGIGNGRSNVFSINAKKTRYNIYCNDVVFEFLNGGKYIDTEFVNGGNASDRTRPNAITVTNTDTLLKMIDDTVAFLKLQ